MKERLIIKRCFKMTCLLLIAMVWGAADSRGVVNHDHADLDIAIVNGRVLDPETGLDAIRNVGVSKGKIVEISEEPLQAHEKIDAAGLVVAPGFIDLHQHGQDAYNYAFKARDGVTTALELEGGPLDVDEWYANRQGSSLINYGTSVGYSAVRIRTLMGASAGQSLDSPLPPASGPATLDRASERQIAEIQDWLQLGLNRGALGVGLGIAYTPGASREEILELFRSAAKYSAPVFVHLRFSGRSELSGCVDALEEVVADVAIAGGSLHVVHISSMGIRDSMLLIGMIRGARLHGLDVTVEAYPYGAAMTDIASSVFDPGWQQRLGIDYQDLQWIATGERLDPESFARYRKMGGLVVMYMVPEDIVRAVIADPTTIIASDGYLSNGKGHPRGAGTYARVLGRWVREEKALTLMDALRKMTLMPAERLEARVPEMKNKGRIQVGSDADITVFDPDKVLDRATYENPAQPSVGIPYVVVNGVLVVKNGQAVAGVSPGRPVRAARH